jgi:UDP-GlcNAc:undecaprenyl-phosphate GlcNAc-1-phosphate transferase
MSGSTWTAAVIYAITFGIAVLVTAAATPLIVRLARHLGVLDIKDEERRVHEVPTPRIGGVAVFFGFACALFAVLGFALASPLALLPSATHLTAAHQIELLTDRFASVHQLVGLLFGSLLILAVGIWDDVIGMRPRIKLVAQVLVALISLFYGFVIPGVTNPFVHDPNSNWIEFPLWLGVPITLLWYVGMMNAINFIDGLDGLLSGVTAISSIFIFAISVLHANPVVALVIGGSKQAIAISVVIPLVVLALPVLDTAAAIVRRAAAGKRITEADRGHFHHQLIFRFGLNVRQAVLLLYAVCFVLGAVALALSGEFTHVFRHA